MRTGTKRLVTSALLTWGIAGCYVVQPSGWNAWNGNGNYQYGQQAELLLDITFNGVSTCSQAGVDTVQVGFPDGVGVTQSVPCGSTPLTLDITNIDSGPMAVEIDGLSNGTIIYTTTETLDIQPGQQQMAIDLTSITPTWIAPGATVLTASFQFGVENPNMSNPPSLNCTQAGVGSVALIIDGNQPIIVPCYSISLGADAAVIPIDAGTHTVDLQGWSGSTGNGNKLYETSYDSVGIQGGSNARTFSLAGLEWGGVNVTWNFSSSGADCSDADVSILSYSVVDAVGNTILSQQTRRCASGGFSLSGMQAGVYTIPVIQGVGASSHVVYSASNVQLYVPSDSSANVTVTLQ